MKVIFAILVTVGVSLAAILPITMLITMTFGWLSSVVKEKRKYYYAHFLQLLGYTGSDFVGLYLGGLIQRGADKLGFLPILCVLEFVISLLYMGKKFSFATTTAEHLNKIQKIMSILGSLIAIGLIITVRVHW